MTNLTDTVGDVQTLQFINENPISVAISRRARIATASGGYVAGAPVLISAQIGRLVRSGVLNAATGKMAADGDVEVPRFTLVLPRAANVQKGDTFPVVPKTYRVESVSSNPPWRTSAEVIEHG